MAEDRLVRDGALMHEMSGCLTRVDELDHALDSVRVCDVSAAAEEARVELGDALYPKCRHLIQTAAEECITLRAATATLRAQLVNMREFVVNEIAVYHSSVVAELTVEEVQLRERLCPFAPKLAVLLEETTN